MAYIVSGLMFGALGMVIADNRRRSMMMGFMVGAMFNMVGLIILLLLDEGKPKHVFMNHRQRRK
jgi:sulfite exporter TauE/SafE